MARMPSLCPAVVVLILASSILLGFFADVQAEKLTYSLELPQDYVTVLTDAGVATIQVSAAGYDLLAEEGSPELPYRIISVLLPQGDTVESFRFTTDGPVLTMLPRAAIAQAGPMVAEDGTVGRGEPLAAASDAGTVFPEALGRYLGTSYLHGRAIASFAVFPVRVDSGDLVLTEKVTVEITTTLASAEDAPVVRERFREGFQKSVESMLEAFVVNPEMNGRYMFDEVAVEKEKGGFQPTTYPSLEGSPVDYLIVTTDALAGEYQRLADWKTIKGVPTVVRTVEWIEANTRNGVDLPETIRFFIQDAYAKWGITYVLLGGDTDIMPPRYALSRFYLGGTELPTDMYFGCLDGSWNDTHDKYWGEGFSVVPYDNPDLYAEVYNGRIPRSDLADVSLMIDKIIAYETPLFTDYMDRYMFLAEVLFPVDWKNPDPISLNGADFAEFIYATSLQGKPIEIIKMYETDWLYANAVNENKQAAIDSMETGINHINHVGHGFRFNMSVGNASILNEDADVLTNGGRYFNLYMLNCTAAAYEFFCLAEHYLANPNGGAVSVVGSNESAFPNASGNYMNEYYELLFNDDVVHIGETFARSRLPRTPVAVAGDNVDLWTHYIYTLLADPEMPLYTAQVKSIDVFHVANVGLGTSSVLVNVTSGGVPVDSAFVCLSKDNDDYQYGATNAVGNVVFDFTAESPGEITVVVTGLNLIRHQDTITVDPSAGAYVNFASLTVDDDQSGGTFGNGDGIIDAGETIDFTLELTNTGGASSGNVTAKFRCDDALATVLDSTATFGVIGSGSNATASDVVRVMFDAAIVDEQSVEFDLSIENNGSPTWADMFRREVHAPDLALTTLRIYDDPPYGNGNGVNEDNEEFLLFYGLKNYGTGTASDLTAVVTDLSGQVTVHDGTDVYPDLSSIIGGENLAGFHLEETNTSIENLVEVAVTDLFGRVYRDTVELRVPDPPLAIEFDSSLGPDRLEVAWPHSLTPDVVRYNVYHSEIQGGPYTLANVDPLDHAVYLDTGLSASTLYYFVITSIDGSGNESVISGEFSASTNPPQMPGFPIQMKTTTTSSPVVGDIDGDGDLEIICGNEYIYAWHHDGIELRDGDNDPQTWGVLTPDGDEFTAPITLASLDDKPGLDIIAADLGTVTGIAHIYCVDYNGDALPGWPKVGEHDFRAAPSAGDLDGDGDCEVIAIDSQGVIYAWYADGTEYRDGDNNPSTDGVFFRTAVTSFHFATPTVCDLDNDGKDEIIVGTRADSVWALNDNGTAVPGFPYYLGADAGGSICAGDIDNDGFIELLVQTKGLVGKAHLINHDGTLAAGSWPRNAKIRDIFFTPSPAIADFNNDGYLESVLYAWDGTSTKIWIFDHTGSDYPGWPKTLSNNFTDTSSLTVADVDGDGGLDIVLGDESRFIYAWDINGVMVPGYPVQAEDAVRSTPYLTDVDQDGDIDMIVHSWDQSIYAFDLSGAYNAALAPWPTVGANSHRNGCYGFAEPTGIGDDESPHVSTTHAVLHQNYPNPFNPTTRIEFVVPQGATQHVSLVVYDVTGARVRTLIEGTRAPGLYDTMWDGRDMRGNPVGSGVYFYRFRSDQATLTKKMILLK